MMRTSVRDTAPVARRGVARAGFIASLTTWLLPLWLAMSTGCVRYHARPLSPADTAQAFTTRTLDAPAVRGFIGKVERQARAVWPPVAWDLGDLTLAAFYYSPDLDVARAQWTVAKAGTRTAGERPNPTLGLAPAYDTTTRTPSPWMPLAVLDIPVETAGKRGHRMAQAAHLSEAARLGVASVAWQVRSRVRSTLLSLYAAREAEALLSDQRAIQDEAQRLFQRQYAVGAVSGFDLTQAKIALATTQLAWRDAQRQSAEARVTLAGAIGVSVHALDGVELSFAGLAVAPSLPSVAEARSEALLHRTDVLAALAEYSASQAALQLEIANQYPDLHLGPGYQYDQGDDKWTLGFTLTLPIFGRNRGPIATAEGRRAEAAARFEALQARVLAEIDGALAAYDAAMRKKGDTDALLVDLEKQERTARAVYDAGEISKSELLGLRLQLGVTAVARLDALVKSQQALGSLEDALQSPLGWAADAWETAPRPTHAAQGTQ